MTTEHAFPVKYVLYSHYPEGDDLKAYPERKVEELDGVKDLVRHLKRLQGLLTWTGFEGLLVLFYAPGLAECLDGIQSRKTKEDLERNCKGLQFARAVDTYLQDRMREEYKDLVPRLRFVTALDLHKVFGRITNSELAGYLKSWIVGDAGRGTYDSPKIVEAIVRLRLLGTGVPVFRVDHDVLFRKEKNWDKKNLEFSSTIGSCLRAYEKRRDSPNLSSFIFSASYDHKALGEMGEVTDFVAWSQAFATRVFPALIARKDWIDEALDAIANGESEDKAWSDYALKSFRPSLARKFYGFENAGLKISKDRGLGAIGAHPTSAVISGAMLYMSDGAILDLPPFSNFAVNVSWIDDHLKYSLHRELRHLNRFKFSANSPEAIPDALLAYSKLDEVIVEKAGRKIRGNFAKYIFDDYLPTLLRGTIMDAWITNDPLLKCRYEDLAPQDREVLKSIRQQQPAGAVLPSALHRALEKCSFERPAKNSFENELKMIALKRINAVRRQWLDLREPGAETFASVWAKGEAKSKFKNLHLKYQGIPNRAPKMAVKEDIPKLGSIDGELIQDVTDLVKNASDYIEWTLKWPTIVQVVRSIEQGSLRTDLNFDPEHEVHM
ncbi:MAG: hypothetical protein ACXW3C_04245 [Pyrinomonadaceae bacterium]